VENDLGRSFKERLIGKKGGGKGKWDMALDSAKWCKRIHLFNPKILELRLT
jgi:hypothetical protein